MTNENQDILNRNASTASLNVPPAQNKAEYLSLPGSHGHVLAIRRHSIPVLTVTPSALSREDVQNMKTTTVQADNTNGEKHLHIQKPIPVRDDFFSKARRYCDRETNGDDNKSQEKQEQQPVDVTKTHVLSGAKEHVSDVTTHEDNSRYDDDNQSRKQVTQTALSVSSQPLTTNTEDEPTKLNIGINGLKTSSSHQEMASAVTETSGDEETGEEATDDKGKSEDDCAGSPGGSRRFSLMVCTPSEVNGDSLVIVSENYLQSHRKTVNFDHDDEDNETDLVMRKTPYSSDISDGENTDSRPDSASTVGSNVGEVEVENRPKSSVGAESGITDEEPSTSLPSTPSRGSTSVDVLTPEPTFQVPSLGIQTPSPPLYDYEETENETNNPSSRTVSINESCDTVADTATTAAPCDTSLVGDEIPSTDHGGDDGIDATNCEQPFGEFPCGNNDVDTGDASRDFPTETRDEPTDNPSSTPVNNDVAHSPNDLRHDRSHSSKSEVSGEGHDSRSPSTDCGRSTADFEEQEARVNAHSGDDESDEESDTDTASSYSESSDYENTRSDVTLDDMGGYSVSRSNEKPQMTKSLHDPVKHTGSTDIVIRRRAGKKSTMASQTAAVAIGKSMTGNKHHEKQRAVRKPSQVTRSNVVVSKLGVPNKSKSLPNRGPRTQLTKANLGPRSWAHTGPTNSTPTHLHPPGGRVPDRLTPLLAEERLRMTPSPRHSSLTTQGSVSLAPSSLTMTEERWRPKGVPSQLRSEAYLQDGKLCITVKGPSRALPALQLAASRPESVPLDVRIMLVQDNRRATPSRKLPPLGAMKGARRPFTPPDRNVVENRAAWQGFNTRMDPRRRQAQRRRLIKDSLNNSKDNIPSPSTAYIPKNNT